MFEAMALSISFTIVSCVRDQRAGATLLAKILYSALRLSAWAPDCQGAMHISGVCR